MKASGATNRQRHAEAESSRQAEETHAPLRLAHLSEELATLAQTLMDQVLSGELPDPDAPELVALPEDEDEPEKQ